MSSATILKLELDNLSADRAAISQCAKYVRGRLAQMQAAEAWISCGERLEVLKRGLMKSSPRGDNERIGWKQAFENGEFPFGRRHADKLIAVSVFFSGHEWPSKKLPSSVASLIILATKFTPDMVKQCAEDGRLSPGSTEADVTSLGKKLGLIKPKARKRNLAKAPKSERLMAVRKLMKHLGITIEDFQ